MLILGELLGNLGRMEIWGGGVIGLDFVALGVVFWGVIQIWRGKWKMPKGKFWVIWGGILGMTILSWIWGTWKWGLDLGASALLGRLIVFWSLLPILTMWVKAKKGRGEQIKWGIWGVALGLSLLGILQMIWVPDFTFMEKWGWDPHQDRLFSTWFDPNLLGSFLSFVVVWGMALGLEVKKWDWQKWVWVLGLGVILGAVILTWSRSAWLALGIGLGVLLLIKNWKLLLILILGGGIFVGVSERAQERIGGIFDLDKSAGARIESWSNGIEVWEESPILGVGWNWLKKVQDEKGMVVSENEHAASGFDSSLLTALSTMGILGGILFLIFWLELLGKGIWVWRKRGSGAGLGLGVGILGLLVSSLFVNALWFPLILVPIWGACALVLKDDH